MPCQLVRYATGITSVGRYHIGSRYAPAVIMVAIATRIAWDRRKSDLAVTIQPFLTVALLIDSNTGKLASS